MLIHQAAGQQSRSSLKAKEYKCTLRGRRGSDGGRVRIERPIRQVAAKHPQRAVAPQVGQQLDELWRSSHLSEGLQPSIG